MSYVAHDTTGLILAGGSSRRFGSDKACCVFSDRSMIEHVYSVLEPLVAAVLISVRTPQHRTGLPAPHVGDQYPGLGPLAGLHAGFGACATEWVLVAACDTPYLTQAVLRDVLSARAPAHSVVVRTPEGRIHPLCACYSRSLLPLIEVHLRAGRLALSDLIASSPHAITFVDAPSAALQNVITPSDLNRRPLVSRRNRETGLASRQIIPCFLSDDAGQQ